MEVSTFTTEQPVWLEQGNRELDVQDKLAVIWAILLEPWRLSYRSKAVEESLHRLFHHMFLVLFSFK